MLKRINAKSIVSFLISCSGVRNGSFTRAGILKMTIILNKYFKSKGLNTFQDHEMLNFQIPIQYEIILTLFQVTNELPYIVKLN